jgi:trimethylamine--corrinoid protein Co-methyltransferase
MEAIYRIACAVAGGETQLREKPFMMLYAESISPLLYPDESVDKLLFCAEKGIPVTYPPSPNTGGGGPITLAGALALGNAECLVGLVLTQLIRPGTPFLYGMNTAALDMKSAIVSYGAPEWPTGMAAWCDIARTYGLPIWGAAGATDSKVVDAQAGIEASLSIMTAFLSRCNLVHDVGYIEYGSTSSMEMLVLADEIIRSARHIMGGVEVNELTLARDAIHRAKPGGGFLADDHTLDNWKWAQWRPDLIDRMRYDRWVQKGERDMTARANERARDILAQHQVPPLPAAAEELIADLLRERAAWKQIP